MNPISNMQTQLYSLKLLLLLFPYDRKINLYYYFITNLYYLDCERRRFESHLALHFSLINMVV